MEASAVSIDLYGKTQADDTALAFLKNNNYFLFDHGDEDEKKLLENKLTIPELLYLAWSRSIYADVVHLNKSKIIGIGGTHRSGKSLWAFTMGVIWDKTFFERRQYRVVHTPQAFAAEVQYVKDHNIHGAVFVVDEGGVVVPSDSFYEQWYKELNQSIQVMGYLNPIIIFCAVIRDNIGTKFRKLYNIQTKARRFNNQFSRLKIYDLNYDDLRGKTLPKRPRIRVFGKRYLLDGVRFGKPPKWIEDAYKELSLPRKDKLLNSMLDTQKRTTMAVKSKREIMREEGQKFVEEKVFDVVANYQNLSTSRSKPQNIILDPLKIQNEYRTTVNQAQLLKSKAETMLREAAKKNKPKEPGNA